MRSCWVNSTVRAWIIAAVTVSLSCAVLSSFTHRTPLAAYQTAPNSSAIPDDRTVDTDRDGMIDLYGNDVTAAVAKYSIDATGSLYEVHSPQTEIPKLGSPKT